MRKTITVLAVVFALMALAPTVRAQQAEKVWRIGTLLHGSPATRGHYIEWYRQGFRKLGYVEGRNYVFVSRWSRGNRKRLPVLAKELVHAGVDVILVAGNTPLRAAAKATKNIPIVVGSASGLGTWGLVASLAKPSGNVTGSTAYDPGLGGKRLQLLREVVPDARRVALLTGPTKRGRSELKRIKTAARTLGVKIQFLPVGNLEEFEESFRSITRERADALIIISNSVTNSHRKRVGELVKARKLPAICAYEPMAKTGCLLTYVADWSLMNRRAPIFVDKIFKGANPGDLPVERPTKYKLIVNLKLARAIGIKVPSSILLRATDVIE
jgi:putative ABC transport system substrate-binding protein